MLEWSVALGERQGGLIGMAAVGRWQARMWAKSGEKGSTIRLDPLRSDLNGCSSSSLSPELTYLPSQSEPK